MNKLILLRHGQSQWNLENRFTGWKDVPLTNKGIEEAQNAGKLMKKNNIEINLIFSSVLQRANKTAEIAIKEMKIPFLWKNNDLLMVRDVSLNERDYGDLVGLNKQETANKYGKEQVHKWRRHYYIKPPGGESLEDVVTRVKPYFDKYIMPEIINRKNILVVAHGNSLRASMINLGLYKEDEISNIELPTGSPFVINFNLGKVIDYEYLS